MLKLGDVKKGLIAKPSGEEESLDNDTENTSTMDPHVYDVEWRVGFDQIVAWVSQETSIYHFFDRQVSIRDRSRTISSNPSHAD